MVSRPTVLKVIEGVYAAASNRLLRGFTRPRRFAMRLKISALLSIAATVAIGAAPTAQAQSWAKSYDVGGGGGAADVRQTPDGGFVAAGWTKAFVGANTDMWLVRLDASGNILWQRSYGGAGRDEIEKLHPTPDGGYIGIGLSSSFGAGQHAPLVLKFDANGNVQWQKTYLHSGRDWGFDIVQTTDGGYVIPGMTDPCACGGTTQGTIIKIDASGNIQWQKVYTGQTTFSSLQQTPDGGYIMGGATASFGVGGGDALVLKLDANGNIQWQKTYGGSSYDAAVVIQLTSDGGYILGGSTQSFGSGGTDAWLLKLNSDGSVAWQKAYGGAGYDDAQFIEQTSDGGYVVSGQTNTAAITGTDLWVFKIDASGNLVWQRSYDSGSPSDVALAVHSTSDGGYVVAGFSDPSCPSGCVPAAQPQRFTILKLKSDGSIDPSCPAGVGTSTAATVQNTTGTVQNAPITSGNFNASANNANVTVTNTNATVSTLCSGVLAVPQVPTGLSARVGNGNIYLSWDRSTGQVDGYNVYVDQMNGGTPTPLGTENPSGQLIHDPRWTVFSLPDGSNPRNGTTYRFTVTSVVNGLESQRSAPVFAQPNAFAAPTHPPNPILFVHGFLEDGRLAEGSFSETTHFLKNTLSWAYGGQLYHPFPDDLTTKVDPEGDCPPDQVPLPIPKCGDSSVADPSADFYTASFGNNLGNYHDMSGLSHQGDEVKAFVDKIIPNGGNQKIMLVAHSNGGLASRSYIATYRSEAESKVAGLITYGTPHFGADVSVGFPYLFVLFPVNVPDLLSSDGARDAGFNCTFPFDTDPYTFLLNGYSNTIDLSQFLYFLDTQPLSRSGLTYTSIIGQISYRRTPFGNDCHSQFWDGLVPISSADMNSGSITLRPARTLKTTVVHTAQTKDFPAILCALDVNCAEFNAKSPVELEITAPSGKKMAKDFAAIPGASYMNVPEDDGHEGVTVLIPFPEGGQYTDNAIPTPGTLPTDTFTITLTQNGVTTTIADHMQIQSIPPDGFHPHVNSRPFANAGFDQIVECAGPSGELVTLNGSASGDQDGDQLTYVWTDSQGNVAGNATIVTVQAHMGTQSYNLTITDPSGLSATAQTHVVVRDTTPPIVTSSVALPGGVLQQNNHTMTNVGLAVAKSDICTTSPTVTVQVFGNEDDQTPTDSQGTVFSPDASNIAPGTLRLRAERSDSGSGRVYLIVVKAMDGAGNFSLSTSTVVVPKSTSAASINAVNSLAAAARAFALNPANKNSPQPPGYFVIGDGPVIGSKQ